jgi:acyl carrier protein
MKLEDFITHFAAQFESAPPDAFSADAIFREIDGWDSLTALSVISMIDEEYSVQITGADLRGVTTINQLFELVSSRSSAGK